MKDLLVVLEGEPGGSRPENSPGTEIESSQKARHQFYLGKVYFAIFAYKGMKSKAGGRRLVRHAEEVSLGHFPDDGQSSKVGLRQCVFTAMEKQPTHQHYIYVIQLKENYEDKSFLICFCALEVSPGTSRWQANMLLLSFIPSSTKRKATSSLML